MNKHLSMAASRQLSIAPGLSTLPRRRVASSALAVPALEGMVVPHILRLDRSPEYLAAPRSLAPLVAAPACRLSQDSLHFRLDSTVEQWRSFQNTFHDAVPGAVEEAFGWPRAHADLSTSLARLARMVRDSAASANPLAAAYWAYHSTRLAFFLTQVSAAAVQQWLVGSVNGTRDKTMVERLGPRAAADLTSRVTESVAVWQQDCSNVLAGRYRLPWDMTEPRHPQNNPLELIGRSFAFLGEAAATLQRSVGGVPEPLWMTSGMYPDYYTNSFHYQTDGWLSDTSASLYEHSTEALFLGRQDAMQRTALLPLGDLVARRGGDAQGGGLRLLEVACGTGRFHTYIKDNFPNMSTVASDLSPFYLQAARRNVQRWQELRSGPRGAATTTSKHGSAAGTTNFVQAAAEELNGVPDGSFDVVMNVYLFHELPMESRHKAAAAMFRALRPGGTVILADSLQLGDRPDWDAGLTGFTDFNEPYYQSYVALDLGALFREAGFECGTKYMCSTTKVLTFTKPTQ